jgi:cation/acetate symporter
MFGMLGVSTLVSALCAMFFGLWAALAVALVAAFVATFKPAEILPLVSASFSLAASAFVPAMVLGIFWKRANRKGAVAGMLAGLGITVCYMTVNAQAFRAFFGLPPGQQLWLGIHPVSAGVFGVPIGFAVAVIVSLLTRAVPRPEPALVDPRAAAR